MVPVVELSQIETSLLIVKFLDISIEPYILASDGGLPPGFQSYPLHGIFPGHHIASRSPALDVQLGEIILVYEFLELEFRLEENFHGLSLSIGIDRQPLYDRTRSALGDVIFLVAGDGSQRKSLGVAHRPLAVAVDDIVDGPAVASCEQTHIFDIVAHIDFLAHLAHHIFAVLEYGHELRHIRAVADILRVLVLLQGRTHEALHLVHIQFQIVVHHLGGCNVLESGDFGKAGPLLAVFFLEA